MKLPERKYDLSLGFAEIYSPACKPSMRKFVVAVTGQTPASVDVFEKVGCGAPYTLRFDNVAPAGGDIVVGLRSVIDNAFLSTLCFKPVPTDGNGSSGSPSASPLVVISAGNGQSTAPSPANTPKVSSSASASASSSMDVALSPVVSQAASPSTQPPAPDSSAQPSLLPSSPVLPSPSGLIIDPKSTGYSCTNFGSSMAEGYKLFDKAAISGDYTAYITPPSAGTNSLPPAYRNHVYGRNWGYRLKVENDERYDIVLGFAETYSGNCAQPRDAKARVFTVTLAGGVHMVDVMKSAGCNAVHQMTFRNVSSSDGELKILLSAISGDAMLSVICHAKAPIVGEVTSTAPSPSSSVLAETAPAPSADTTTPTTSPPSPTMVTHCYNFGDAKVEGYSNVVPASFNNSLQFYSNPFAAIESDSAVKKVYQSHIFGGSFQLTIPSTPSSAVSLTFGFAEIFAGNCLPNARVFQVKSGSVSRTLNVFKEVGCKKPLNLHFNGISSSADGKVIVSLKSFTNLAMLSAVCIKTGGPSISPSQAIVSKLPQPSFGSGSDESGGKSPRLVVSLPTTPPALPTAAPPAPTKTPIPSSNGGTSGGPGNEGNEPEPSMEVPEETNGPSSPTDQARPSETASPPNGIDETPSPEDDSGGNSSSSSGPTLVVPPSSGGQSTSPSPSSGIMNDPSTSVTPSIEVVGGSPIPSGSSGSSTSSPLPVNDGVLIDDVSASPSPTASSGSKVDKDPTDVLVSPGLSSEDSGEYTEAPTDTLVPLNLTQTQSGDESSPTSSILPTPVPSNSGPAIIIVGGDETTGASPTVSDATPSPSLNPLSGSASPSDTTSIGGDAGDPVTSSSVSPNASASQTPIAVPSGGVLILTPEASQTVAPSISTDGSPGPNVIPNQATAVPPGGAAPSTNPSDDTLIPPPGQATPATSVGDPGPSQVAAVSPDPSALATPIASPSASASSSASVSVSLSASVSASASASSGTVVLPDVSTSVSATPGTIPDVVPIPGVSPGTDGAPSVIPAVTAGASPTSGSGPSINPVGPTPSASETPPPSSVTGGGIVVLASFSPTPEVPIESVPVAAPPGEVQSVPDTNDNGILQGESGNGNATIAASEGSLPSIVAGGKWKGVMQTGSSGIGFTIAMGIVGALLVLLLLTCLFFAISRGGGASYSYSSQYSGQRPSDYDPSQGGYTEEMGTGSGGYGGESAHGGSGSYGAGGGPGTYDSRSQMHQDGSFAYETPGSGTLGGGQSYGSVGNPTHSAPAEPDNFAEYASMAEQDQQQHASYGHGPMTGYESNGGTNTYADSQPAHTQDYTQDYTYDTNAYTNSQPAHDHDHTLNGVADIERGSQQTARPSDSAYGHGAVGEVYTHGDTITAAPSGPMTMDDTYNDSYSRPVSLPVAAGGPQGRHSYGGEVSGEHAVDTAISGGEQLRDITNGAEANRSSHTTMDENDSRFPSESPSDPIPGPSPYERDMFIQEAHDSSGNEYEKAERATRSDVLSSPSRYGDDIYEQGTQSGRHSYGTNGYSATDTRAASIAHRVPRDSQMSMDGPWPTWWGDGEKEARFSGYHPTTMVDPTAQMDETTKENSSMPSNTPSRPESQMPDSQRSSKMPMSDRTSAKVVFENVVTASKFQGADGERVLDSDWQHTLRPDDDSTMLNPEYDYLRKRREPYVKAVATRLSTGVMSYSSAGESVLEQARRAVEEEDRTGRKYMNMGSLDWVS